MEGGAIKNAVMAVMNEACSYADHAAMFLGNITRSKDAARAVLECEASGESQHVVAALADVFCRGPAFNKHATYHHLGHVLFNVTQVRRCVMGCMHAGVCVCVCVCVLWQ